MASRAKRKKAWREHQKRLGITKKPKQKLGSIHDKKVEINE